MKTLEFKWTVSRGRDSYGYNICSLYADGVKVAACNGGGYDMKGTCLGNYIARAFADRLRALKPSEMPAQSHWERAETPRRICRNITCVLKELDTEKEVKSVWREKTGEEFPNLKPDALACPFCGNETKIDHQDGKRIDDGRYFYGLTFHDPNYDPGKAVIGQDCQDRTFSGKSKGKTVEQAEKDGDTAGLERYQAFYTASSKTPTPRHTVPLIDGACGFSSVEAIAKAIGISLEYIAVRSKKLDVFRLHDERENRKAA